MIKETLKRNTTLESSGRLKVDEIGGGEDSLGPKNEVEEKRRSSTHEPSQEGGDAFAQPCHSEHEHQDKRTEEDYPAQQGLHVTNLEMYCPAVST